MIKQPAKGQRVTVRYVVGPEGDTFETTTTGIFNSTKLSERGATIWMIANQPLRMPGFGSVRQSTEISESRIVDWS